MTVRASSRFGGSPVRAAGELAALVAASGAVIHIGAERPMYDIRTDEIRLPAYAADVSPSAYFSDLAHELIHWTRHPSRLDRDLGMTVWCDPGCAHEEVVAELGAIYLCAGLGMSLQSRADYIIGWLYWVQNRNIPLLSAARYAAQAVCYLKRFQAAV